MKRIRKIVGAMLALCLCLFLSVPTFAAGEEYTYTIRFFSGKQGTFSEGEMMVFTDLHYGDRVNFYRIAVTLNDNSKYYIRGIRESGRDNSDSVSDQTASVIVTGDRDYVVAYGILGDATSYTINYEDENGRALAPSETYYGNVGDKPVVAYQYIAGYRPQAYNLTQTLKKDPAENVFTFVYVREQAAGEEDEDEDTTEGQETPTPPAAPAEGTGTPGEGEGTTTTAGPAGGDGGVAVIPGGALPGGDGAVGADAEGLTEVPDGEVPQTDELVDLDDEEVPLTDLPAILNLASDAKLLGIPIPLIVASLAILGGGWYFVVMKKRKKKEESS